jgi:hypothetical protein
MCSMFSMSPVNAVRSAWLPVGPRAATRPDAILRAPFDALPQRLVSSLGVLSGKLGIGTVGPESHCDRITRVNRRPGR